jgi:hypothetical protein
VECIAVSGAPKTLSGPPLARSGDPPLPPGRRKNARVVPSEPVTVDSRRSSLTCAMRRIVDRTDRNRFCQLCRSTRLSRDWHKSANRDRVPTMARDKGRHDADAHAGYERLIEEHFGRPWDEIKSELHVLQGLHRQEVEGWNAWRELGCILRRIERIAFADAATERRTSPRESIPQADAESELAASRRKAVDAFPRGLRVADHESVRNLTPVRPSGHPWLGNRRYLQEWIREFPPGRLLEWRGDDLPHALNGLRRRLGDHRGIDELLDERSPAPRQRLPEAPVGGVQWLVFLFEARELSFAPDPEKVQTKAIAAVYALLMDSKESTESITGRISKARERYRAGIAGPAMAPRRRRKGNDKR